MPSVIDNLFNEIYGYMPAKDGQAYEMLTTMVMKILGEKNDVFHDERLRGKFTQTLYQIDTLLKSSDGDLMGEAKDYTDRGAKVGRADLQKLAGALNDVEVDGGLFFSATDYTKPAKKYAEAAERIVGKKIDLFHLRPSIERDEEGRIKTVIIKMVVCLPDYVNANFSLVFTPNGNEKIKSLLNTGVLKEGSFHIRADTIYNEYGSELTTIHNLTSCGFGGDYESAQGSFILHGGHIKIKDHLVEIYGITYDVPYKTITEDIIIETKGIPKLLIKDEKGNINKLITDEDLKRVKLINGKTQLT